MKIGSSNHSAADDPCEDGYTGLFCELCSDEYFRDKSNCTACSGVDATMPFWTMLVAMAFLLLLPFGEALRGVCVRLYRGPDDAMEPQSSQDVAEGAAKEIAQWKILRADILDIISSLKPLKSQSRSLILIGQLLSSWIDNFYAKFTFEFNLDFHATLKDIGRALSILNINLNVDVSGALMCSFGFTRSQTLLGSYLVQALLPVAAILVLAVSTSLAWCCSMPGNHGSLFRSATIWVLYLSFGPQSMLALSHLPARGSNFDCGTPTEEDIRAWWSQQEIGDPTDWTSAQVSWSQRHVQTLSTCRFVGDYSMHLDSMGYRSFLPIFVAWFLIVAIVGPVWILAVMYRRRKQLDPKHAWACPQLCRLIVDETDETDETQLRCAPVLHPEVGHFQAKVASDAGLEAGSLVLVFSQFVAQRSQEMEEITKRAACITGDSSTALQVFPALLEEDTAMTVPCLGPFVGDGIQPLLEDMLREWRPLHLDPTLDIAYRHANHGRELRFLDPLFDSFWPRYWY